MNLETDPRFADTVGIWILNKSGCQMVQMSLVIKWSIFWRWSGNQTNNVCLTVKNVQFSNGLSDCVIGPFENRTKKVFEMSNVGFQVFSIQMVTVIDLRYLVPFPKFQWRYTISERGPTPEVEAEFEVVSLRSRPRAVRIPGKVTVRENWFRNERSCISLPHSSNQTQASN